MAQNVLLRTVRRRKNALSTRQLRYHLHSVQAHAKCQTVPQCHELVTGTRAVEQDSK